MNSLHSKTRRPAVLTALLLLSLGLQAFSPCARAGEPPRLILQPLPDQKVRLTWTNGGDRVVLEQATALSSATPWSPVAEVAEHDGGFFTVLLDTGNSNRFFRVQVIGPAFTTFSSSPDNGESGVAVTRETILRFDRPLATNTVFGTNTLFAEFGGRRMLSRVELATDRRTATLFYLENLPASARIRVTLNGIDLRDIDGHQIDADLDGNEGGIGHIAFDTLSITPLLGTAIIGRVFASQLVPDPNNATNSVNLPLEGVIVTVDGAEETLRTTTDANGFFRLEPCPSGRFFVHVDGRIAVGSQWPNGDFYPVVGKAWDALHGETNNLAAGTGEIFLPLIKSGTLQPVSAIQNTTITFEPSVIASNPALAGVQITVPANSLYSDNGARGGRVGIAPVPPDRLPEPLAPGLNFPIVITIQTDGPSNFDRPVPVRFPNLPDPATGLALPPGAMTVLWSFNHDTGNWEPQGTMTITPDGNFAESDPGVGVRQPGWHGVNPSTEIRIKPTCDVFTLGNAFKLIKTAADCASQLSGIAEAIAAVANVIDVAIKFGTFLEKFGNEYKSGNLTCESLVLGLDALKSLKDAVVSAYQAAAEQNALNKILGVVACAANVIKLANDIGCGLPSSCQGLLLSRYCAEVAPVVNLAGDAVLRIKTLIEQVQNAPLVGLCFAADALVNRLQAECAQQAAAFGPNNANALIQPDPETVALFDAVLEISADFSNHIATGYAQVAPLLPVLDGAQRTMEDERLRSQIVIGTGGHIGRHYVNAYKVGEEVVEARSVYLVFEKGFEQWIVPLGSEGTNSWYDPEFNVISICHWNAPNPSGEPVPSFLGAPKTICEIDPNCLYKSSRPPRWDEFVFLDASTLPDSDGDGLADAAEEIVNTNPNNPDTDRDGIADLAELRLGLNPTGGTGNGNGIIASVDTAGTAVDVCALNNLAIIADGPNGVVVFDASDPLSPIQAAVVPTIAPATSVACAGNLVAVAQGSAGLAVIDVTVPGTARRLYDLPLGDEARAVAVRGNTVFVGLDSNGVVVVDMPTGTVLERVPMTVAERVDDLGVRGEHLFIATASYLLSYRLGERLAFESGALVSSSAEVFTRRRRLFVGTTHAFVTSSPGYDVIDVTDPTTLVRVGTAQDVGQSSFKQIVDNGSGLGVAAVGVNPRDDGTHDIYLYGLSSPSNTTAFLALLPTPGIAHAVSIFNGLAYVADGDSGLQVLNYLPYDAQGVPPTVTLATSFPLTGPTNGQAEPGQFVTLTATVTDDAQVRNVEFYVDGQVVVTDGNFPFEQVIFTPQLTTNKTNFTVRAKATDTGGNFVFTPEILVQLVPDATGPRVVSRFPLPNSFPGAVDTLLIQFNEPLNPASVSPFGVIVIGAGADGMLATGDDVLVTGGTLSYRSSENTIAVTLNPGLPVGLYKVQVGSPLTDLAGNVVQPALWTLRVLGTTDTDQDGLPDSIEAFLGLDPFNPDSDGDGVLDGDEDPDSDSLPTRWELAFSYDPLDADTDNNSITDGNEDPDDDVLKNIGEFAAGSEPRNPDSDGDSWNDEAEVTGGSNPIDPLVIPNHGFVAQPPVKVIAPAIGTTDGLPFNTIVAQPPISVRFE